MWILPILPAPTALVTSAFHIGQASAEAGWPKSPTVGRIGRRGGQTTFRGSHLRAKSRRTRAAALSSSLSALARSYRREERTHSLQLEIPPTMTHPPLGVSMHESDTFKNTVSAESGADSTRPADGVGTRVLPMVERLRKGHRPFVILMAFGLVAGLLLFRDYGMSTDEYGNAQVGELALKAYQGSREYFGLGSLKDHGPVYFMLFSATSEALNRAIPGWLLPDGRHLTNYVTFLAGVAAFHLICLRLMRRSTALVTTALLAAQPVLFGSAFINQKDVPFASLFLGVIALGLLAADAPEQEDSLPGASFAGGLRSTLKRLQEDLTQEWHALSDRRRKGLLICCGVGLLLLADLFVFGLIRRLGESFVVSAYAGRALWPIQFLYDYVATDAYKTSLPQYLARLDQMFAIFRLGLLGVGGLLGAFAFARSLPSLAQLLRGPAWSIEYPAVVGGAIILGCAISTRQIGLFAGGLVSLYMLYRGRIRAIPILALYWGVAAAVTYATWPYLWPDPIQNMINSFTVIPEFGDHSVLFHGANITSATLPWSYFPTLVVLDTTEPALVLAAIGFPVVVWRTVRNKTNWLIVGIVALWILVPVAWQISRHVPMYNNLRHFLFVLPPLFILAGIGYEQAWALLRSTWARGVLAALVLAPGLVGIAWLHPYEYSYFNSLVGGVSGAAGNFDLDYWCTSLKEGVEFVNLSADYGDTLQVFGPLESAAPYARADLRLVQRGHPLREADMVVVCTHRFGRRWGTDGFRLVYQVRRGRAVFGEVWQRDTADGPSALATNRELAGR